MFLYHQVLDKKLTENMKFSFTKRPAKLPVFLIKTEVSSVLVLLEGNWSFIGRLLYGTGMRLMEVIRLRVKDVDFSRNEITMREGKGGKDRITMLPQSLVEEFQARLVQVKALHDNDLAAGFGEVYMPFALAKKYLGAAKDWGWQYVFPSSRLSIDPRSGVERRHHLDEKGMQRAMKKAIRRQVSISLLRHIR